MDPRYIVAATAVVGALAGCSSSPAAPARTAAPVASSAATTVASTTVASTTAPPATSTAAPVTTATTAPAARPAAPPPTRPASPPTRPAPATTRPATTGCTANLAGQLVHTGSARQLITVESAGWYTSVATVELWQRSGSCWVPAGGPWSGFIGQNGFSDHHAEGDGTTPTGMYGIGAEMYGNAANPGVREPYHLLHCGDWWDEDPSSPEYNTFQELACNQTPPFGGGSEALWQETAPYPSFAVIDYNTGPIIKGAGSAIFLHADTGGPTIGCVSVPLADLDTTLRWIDPAQSPAFVMGPASEITSF